MVDDDTLGVVLDDVADRLGVADLAWRLGGSAGRRLRGVDVDPDDVDVLVDADDLDRLEAAVDDLHRSDHPPPPGWRSAWLRRWWHPRGTWVEFVGGGAVVVDDTLEVLGVHDGVEVAWRGRVVPVSRPDVWDRLADR